MDARQGSWSRRTAGRRAAGLALGILVATGLLSPWFRGSCAGLGSAAAEPAARGATPLAPGVTLSAEIDLAGETSRDFLVDVPADAVEVQLELRSTRGDLDLYVRRNRVAQSEEQSDMTVHGEGGRARLVLGRFSPAPLLPGRWYARVAWGFTTVPTSSHEPLERIPYEIVARVFTTRVDGEAAPGQRLTGTIDPKAGSWRTYTVDVPDGARALRVDIARTSSDLDLFARRGRAVTRIESDVAFAEHPWGRETLIVRPGDRVPLAAGKWYVDVIDGFEEERPIQFDLLVTLAEETPAELLGVPVLADRVGPPGPLDRALAAVAEIATDDGLGSATFITRDGKLLTNAHVVEKLGGGAASAVVVALTLDPKSSAVELFRADVLCFDEALDLALLQVVSGFYGDPLPAGYHFPYLEMGDSTALAIGAPLLLVGYPTTGGLNSRVTITATRGIVSGFDERAVGRVVKTDAELTNGSSGGAALDERGRFVGVPSSTVENGSGQLGFVVPAEVLPKLWLAPAKPR